MWVYGVKGDLWEHYIPNNHKDFSFWNIFFTNIIIDNNNYPIILHFNDAWILFIQVSWQNVSQSIYIIEN